MSTTSSTTPLLSTNDLVKFGRKARSLTELVAKNPRASHTEVKAIIRDLFLFYESAKTMGAKEKTPATVAAWELEAESAADDEDIVIRYVLEQGPHAPHIERQSRKYL